MELAQQFIQRCLRSAQQFFAGQQIVLIIDNAPCHSQAEQVFLESEFSNCTLLRLGPYSPMLNPIESVWSQIKTMCKRQLAIEMDYILSYRAEGNVSATEFRLQCLERIINTSCQEVSRSNILQYMAGVQRFYAGVLNLDNVDF